MLAAVERDVARVQRGVAHDGREQRGLADAVAADDAEALARRERQVDVLEHDGLAVAGRDALEFERAQPWRGLPEIDRAHVGVGANLLRRAFGEDRAAHQHGDALGEAEHEVHVVLDDEHGDVLRQRVDGVEDDVALGARHAGGRLVEQQHLGLQAERDRDLDQALAAIGQLRDALLRRRPRASAFRAAASTSSITSRALAGRPQHGRRRADALGDRDVDVLQHREAAEQPVDLEGARDAELDALGLRDLVMSCL